MAGIAVPRLTAEVLLAHALRRERVYLYAHPEQELREVEWIHYGRYLHERLQGKPTQYITRRQEFYGREFRVTPDVLIPRPETEHVVEAALESARGARRVLDVGTGSGALAVTLQLEIGGGGLGDRHLARPRCAWPRTTPARLGARVDFVACDLMDAIAAGIDGPDRLEPALRAARRSARACSAKCAISSRTSRCSRAAPASNSTTASWPTPRAC